MSSRYDSESYAGYMAKGGGIALVSLAVASVAGLLTRMIMARSFSVHEYGLFFAVVTFLGFLRILRDIGTNEALTRYISKFRTEGKLEKARSVFFSGFVLQAIFTGVLCAIIFTSAGWLSSSFFGDPEAKLILFLMVVCFGAMMPRLFLQSTCLGLRDILWTTIPEPIRIGSTLAVICLLVQLGLNNIEIMALAFILGAVISTSLSYFAFRRRHPEMVNSPNLNPRYFKMLLSFGIFVVLVAVSMTVIQGTDTLMLTALRPLRDVGFYQAARPLAGGVLWAGIGITIPLFPMISELWTRGEEERLRMSLGMLTKFVFILMVPIALIFVVFPSTVLSLLYGPEYIAASNALRILGVGVIFFIGSSPVAVGITGTGNPKLGAKAAGIAACFNITANYLLIPRFGAGGAAMATGISFFLILVLRFYYVKRIMEFPVPIIDILKVFAVGGFFLLAIWILKLVISLNPWLELFAVLAPCLFLYVLLICRTGVLGRRDIETLRKTVPRNVVRIVEALMMFKSN